MKRLVEKTKAHNKMMKEKEEERLREHRARSVSDMRLSMSLWYNQCFCSQITWRCVLCGIRGAGHTSYRRHLVLIHPYLVELRQN